MCFKWYYFFRFLLVNQCWEDLINMQQYFSTSQLVSKAFGIHIRLLRLKTHRIKFFRTLGLLPWFISKDRTAKMLVIPIDASVWSTFTEQARPFQRRSFRSMYRPRFDLSERNRACCHKSGRFKRQPENFLDIKVKYSVEIQGRIHYADGNGATPSETSKY